MTRLTPFSSAVTRDRRVELRGILRNPDISDVQRNAGHYSDSDRDVRCTVTSSWGGSWSLQDDKVENDGPLEITSLTRSGNRDTSERQSRQV